MDARKNFAYSTVATAPSPAISGLTLVVQSGHGTRFPATPFSVVVWPAQTLPLSTNAEILRVSGVAGDTLTFTRQDESSAARTIIAGDQVSQNITNRMVTDVVSAGRASTILLMGA